MKHLFDTNVAKICGVEEAIILENIYFWCKKNEANNKLTNGKPWTYNSVKAFNTIFDYMSPSKIARSLKNLESQGYIEISEFNTNAYDHTKWYCITDKTRKVFGEENEKSICHFDKSNDSFDKSNSQKAEITIADINTNNNPNKSTDTCDDFPEDPTSDFPEDTTSANADSVVKTRNYPYSQFYSLHSRLYKHLVEKGRILDKPLVYNYKAIGNRFKKLLENPFFTEEKILRGIQNAVNDESCLENNFALLPMLSEANLTRLIEERYITSKKSNYQKRHDGAIERSNMITDNDDEYKLY